MPTQSQLPGWVEAVQAQPGPPVTLTLPEPACGPRVLTVGEIEKEHGVIVTKTPEDQSETAEVSVVHLALAFTV